MNTRRMGRRQVALRSGHGRGRARFALAWVSHPGPQSAGGGALPRLPPPWRGPRSRPTGPAPSCATRGTPQPPAFPVRHAMATPGWEARHPRGQCRCVPGPGRSRPPRHVRRSSRVPRHAVPDPRWSAAAARGQRPLRGRHGSCGKPPDEGDVQRTRLEAPLCEGASFFFWAGAGGGGRTCRRSFRRSR